MTALIYDQVCAAEKRRRRKRDLMPDPPKRVVINAAVCEGCGDCGHESNCLSVLPLETEFGRKCTIDQSSCNKNYSCLNGFCPSFVTVHGGRLRQSVSGPAQARASLPEPDRPQVTRPYGILIAGVGGTGVVTIGALLGMAAHLERKGMAILDMAGLAQKYGAVISHVRIADNPDEIHAVRIAAGEAKLVLGCDLVVTASFDSLAKMAPDETHVVVNAHESPTGDFTRRPDMLFPGDELKRLIHDAAGPVDFVDATSLAGALVGESIGTNLFLLGYAYQKGLLPVSAAAIERAITLNGVAVRMNTQAFRWGRTAAVNREAVDKVEARATPERPQEQVISSSLDEIIARRRTDLIAYQDTRYARRYNALVARVRDT